MADHQPRSLQDREFVAAIREVHNPNSSLAQVLDRYRLIGEFAKV